MVVRPPFVVKHHLLVHTASFKKFHRSAFRCEEHTLLNKQAHISEIWKKRSLHYVVAENLEKRDFEKLSVVEKIKRFWTEYSPLLLTENGCSSPGRHFHLHPSSIFVGLESLAAFGCRLPSPTNQGTIGQNLQQPLQLSQWGMGYIFLFPFLFLC